MRFALIDNSSITAVQRLMGQITIKNTLAVDMDILCLENLIEAILFYDTVAVVNDYKDEYRNSRREAFPQFLTLEPDHILYDQLLHNSKKITEGIVPRVEAGQFTDEDFRPFFDLLNMNVIFTWDMASSIYHLTVKMLEGVGGLDVEKYSKLSAAIRFELIDRRHSKDNADVDEKYMLVDSQGNVIKEGYKVVDKEGLLKGTGSQAQSFFASLNWLAFRTVFYTIAASNMKIDLFLHPIRHSFQINFLSKLHTQDPSIFRPLMAAMNRVADDSLNRVLSSTQPFVTQNELPLFVSWFAQKVGDPHKYIEAAYEIREDGHFAQARQRLIELESISVIDNAKFVAEANKLVREVEQAMKSIHSKYYVNTDQGVPSSSLTTLWNLSTILTRLPQLPEFNLHIPQLEPIKHLLPQNGFKGLYRSVVSDLTSISQLGKYYDIVSSRVRVEKDAHASIEKTEEFRYRKFKSSWKLPM